jgi:hypothetical protein
MESPEKKGVNAQDNVLVSLEHFSAPLEMPAKSGMPARRQVPAPQGTSGVEQMMLERGMKVNKAADGQLQLKQGDVDQLVSEGVLPTFKASALIYCPLEPSAMVSNISFTRDGHSYSLSGRKLEALRKASARMQDPNGLVAFELPDKPMVKLTRRDVTNLCQGLNTDAQAGLPKTPPPPPPQPILTPAASANSPPKMLYKPGRKANVGEQLAPIGQGAPASLSPIPLEAIIAPLPPPKASPEKQIPADQRTTSTLLRSSTNSSADGAPAEPDPREEAVAAVRKLKIKDVKKQLTKRGRALGSKASNEECYQALEQAVSADFDTPISPPLAIVAEPPAKQSRYASERYDPGWRADEGVDHGDHSPGGRTSRQQSRFASGRSDPEPPDAGGHSFGGDQIDEVCHRSERPGGDFCYRSERPNAEERYKSERGTRSILGNRFRRKSERFEEKDEEVIDPETGLPETEEMAEYRKSREAVIADVANLAFSDLKAKLFARGIEATGRREVLYARLEEDELKKFDADNPKPKPPVPPSKPEPPKGHIFKVLLKKPEPDTKLGMVLEGVGHVKIESLKPGGLASQSGELRVGLVLMAVDSVPVRNHTHAAGMLKGIEMELTLCDIEVPE